MKRPLFTRYFVPFLQWYALMILIAIGLDFLLHKLQLRSIGLYLGYAGTFTVAISFVYSLRKRKIITRGSPKKLLELHEYLSWAGSVMLLVHAGIHFNSILPWLAILMLLTAVASGLVGKFLLKNAREMLAEKKKYLIESGLSKEEAERKLFFDSITVDMMKNWRKAHIPITGSLLVLSLFHILSVMIFST
ncbi:MAG TPA: hypothetical protein VF145_05205 [Chitinophagaceae bacterium]